MIKKIFFVFSLTGIFLLIIITQNIKHFQSNTIKSIQYSNNKITIQIENNSAELIIFDNSHLNLEKGNKIKFQGKQDMYKGKEQIIIDKIFLIK